MSIFCKLFTKKYSVCKECGVHFEPVIGYQARWGDLCSVHRSKIRERDEKHDAVINWAELNWERLYKQMDDEKREQYKKEDILRQSVFQQMAAMQANQSNAMQQANNAQGLCSAGMILGRFHL